MGSNLLGGNLDLGLLDDADSFACLALAGAVALFARGLLHIQEFERDRIEEPGESGTVTR